jgi:hypothetical protein
MASTNPLGLHLFETFERLTIDQELHFFLENDRGERIQIQFKRAEDKPWTLFFVAHRDTSQRTVSRAKLAPVLAAMGSSLDALESEVTAHLLMQAGYCDHFIREVSELVGQHAVQQAILGTQRLMDDLAISVRQVLGPAAQPEDAPHAKRSSLRIIRD